MSVSGDGSIAGNAATSRLLARLALADPNAIAAIDQYHRQLSYGELLAQIAKHAATLPASGLALVEASPTLGWLEAYLACWRRGLSVLLTPRGDAYALDRLRAQFRPKLLMREENGYAPEIAESAADTPIHADLALMLSTSGSTGDAKCVKLSHSNVAANAESIAQYLEITPGHRGLVNLPVHYSYGLSIVHSHLWAGATILLTDQSVIDDSFWAFAKKHAATSFAGVPHVYELLHRTDLEQHAPPSLRYFTQAGGRLRAELVSHFAEIAAKRDWRFFVMYGQTEATARMAYVPPDVTRERPGVIGKAIPGGKLSVQEENGAPLAQGVEGELVYEGPNVMMGYAYSSDDLAAPPSLDKLVTGDLAVQEPDGLFRITGRKARFVKLFGARVSLDSVERRLEELGHPGAAVGTDDNLVVYITDRAAEKTHAKLAEWLGVPERSVTVEHIDELPRLASGKTDYANLNARAPKQDESAAPAGNVLAAFQTAFPHDTVEDESTFDALGGDSLTYVSLALDLERMINPLPSDWSHRSVAELSALALAPPSGKPKARNTLLASMESARGLACLLVVYAHVIGFGADQGLELPDGDPWRLSVQMLDFLRMPLFVAISGFVYAAMAPPPGAWRSFTKRKLIQLGIPLAFATFVFWLMRGVSSGTFDDIVRAYTWGYQHLWFLGSLLIILILAATIDSVLKAPKSVWWIVLVFTAFTAHLAPDLPVLHFYNTAVLIPFFALGVVMQRHSALFSSRNALIAAALLSAYIFGLEAFNIANGRLPYDGIWVLGFPLTAGVIVLLLNTIGRTPWLALIAIYSFTIYLWHPLPNAVVREALQAIGLSSIPVVALLGFIAGVGVPIAMHLIASRIPIVRTLVTGR